MWICKECGGDIVVEAEIITTVDFTIDKDGIPENPDCGFSLEELARDSINTTYYHCANCGISTERVCLEELEDIAEWVEE